ncbi:Sec-independent protein translocase subunit TatA/TatB [Streptomyces adustus]|uniref:Sec-independent protein translocase subunit TatA/TatB n=1 Tax=Streptomyces adustus TaxID=1609272 RepID=UPI003722754F
MFGVSELTVNLVVVIGVIGIRKRPELTRTAGKATRTFTSEAKALKDQDSQGSTARSAVWSLALASAGTKAPRASEGSVWDRTAGTQAGRAPGRSRVTACTAMASVGPTNGAQGEGERAGRGPAGALPQSVRKRWPAPGRSRAA